VAATSPPGVLEELLLIQANQTRRRVRQASPDKPLGKPQVLGCDPHHDRDAISVRARKMATVRGHPAIYEEWRLQLERKRPRADIWLSMALRNSNSVAKADALKV
jgi:hypothetical protein